MKFNPESSENSKLEMISIIAMYDSGRVRIRAFHNGSEFGCYNVTVPVSVRLLTQCPDVNEAAAHQEQEKRDSSQRH